jgi:hypothetical protein
LEILAFFLKLFAAGSELGVEFVAHFLTVSGFLHDVLGAEDRNLGFGESGGLKQEDKANGEQTNLFHCMTP